jgi:hypothetical protein
MNSESGGTDVHCGKYDSVGEKRTNITEMGTVDPQCFCIIIKYFQNKMLQKFRLIYREEV